MGLSVMDCAKGKYKAHIVRAGRYRHVGLVENQTWTVNDDISDKILSRNIIIWEDETVYGDSRPENEFEKTNDVLGEFYSLCGYCMQYKESEDRRTVEKEV